MTHTTESSIQSKDYSIAFSPSLKNKNYAILVAVLWLFQEKILVNNGVGA